MRVGALNVVGVWFAEEPTETGRLIQSHILLKMMLEWMDALYPSNGGWLN